MNPSRSKPFERAFLIVIESSMTSTHFLRSDAFFGDVTVDGGTNGTLLFGVGKVLLDLSRGRLRRVMDSVEDKELAEAILVEANA